VQLFNFDRTSGPIDAPSASGRLRDDEIGSRAATPPQPIRVLHVAQSVAGGIASYFEEIAAHQNRTFGQENVKFLIPSDGEQHLASIDPAQLTFFASRSRRAGTLLDFSRTAMRTIEQVRPNVVHLHSSFAGALRMFIPARRASPTIVYCPHGWAFGMEVSSGRKLAYAAVERRLAHATDLIIANSKSEHALAVQYGLPSQKLRVIANGVSWAPLRRRPASTGGISIAFIGRHDRQKGLDILLDTIERFRLPHIHFHVVGEAIWNDGRNSSAHVRPNITFHGWLNRAATTDLLGKVDAVVMPSRWEAFGLVAIEAMRAGVPVIASNRGALPEVVAHSVGGYIFDLDDQQSLGLLLMHLDRSELRRLGFSARDRWEKHFVADRMNSEIEQAYRQQLSKAAHRPERASPAVLDAVPELSG
jgi:glycosyltransferase involved in cell wall biosynthesis